MQSKKLLVVILLCTALSIMYYFPNYNCECSAIIFAIIILILYKKSCPDVDSGIQRKAYISTINHDLKIPVLAQIRALELLSKENTGKLNENQKEIVNLTLNSCKFMYEMLSTILSTYKYENKEMHMNFENISMDKLLDGLMSDCSKLKHGKNLDVKMSSNDGYFVIKADRIQIKKAFEKLIEHCIYVSDENSEIICSINDIGNRKLCVTLNFRSNYITENDLKEMFETYIANKMERVGSSLGLYLAKQIIEAHRGRISIKCENGFNYIIELPCIKECKVPAVTQSIR